MLIRKSTAILDKGCFNYEQLFHPVQCSARKICQLSSIVELVLPGVTGILSTLNQLKCLWGTNCSGNGARQYWDCLYQSWSLHILPFYRYILSILGKKILFWYQSFQCLAIVAFQLQLVLVFREKFLELWVQHDEVPILISASKRGSYFFQCSNSSWLKKKEK